MSDKNRDNEEEYQFPEAEYVEHAEESVAHDDATSIDYDDASTVSAKNNSLMSKLKNKRIILGVVGAVVVLILFNAMHKSDVKPVAVEKAPAPVVQQQPDTKLVGQLNKLKKIQADSESSTTLLKDEVDDLKSSLTEANQSQVEMAQKISELSAQLKTLNEAVIANKPKPKKTVMHKKTAVVKKITYALQSVVPGRAWVKSSEGLFLTLSVGKALPQYGVVENINADQGVVTTSSGKTIVYGADDS